MTDPSRPSGPRRRPPPKAPPGPEAVGSVLKRLVRDLRLEERSRQGALAGAWNAAAGEHLASRARPVSFRAGLLTVEVDGAALLQEVRGFRAAGLLEAVRSAPGGDRVREIRYVPAGRAGGRS